MINECADVWQAEQTGKISTHLAKFYYLSPVTYVYNALQQVDIGIEKGNGLYAGTKYTVYVSFKNSTGGYALLKNFTVETLPPPADKFVGFPVLGDNKPGK